LLATVGEDAGAKLYDDAAGVFERVPMHGELVAKKQYGVEGRAWNAKGVTADALGRCAGGEL